MKRFLVHFPEKLMDQCREIAKALGIKRSKYIRRAVITQVAKDRKLLGGEKDAGIDQKV